MFDVNEVSADLSPTISNDVNGGVVLQGVWYKSMTCFIKTSLTPPKYLNNI